MKQMRSLAIVVLLSLPVYAADPGPPQCLTEQIKIQQLTQENTKLVQQLMQLQFTASQQAQKTAATEQVRLEALKPKPDDNPKKASALAPVVEKK